MVQNLASCTFYMEEIQVKNLMFEQNDNKEVSDISEEERAKWE